MKSIVEESLVVKTSTDSRAIISLAEIEALLKRGYSQTAIAEMYGVSKQYISWILHYYGGSTLTSPKALVFKHWPWPEMAKGHAGSSVSPYRAMRLHGEYIASDGKGMSTEKLRRLRTFYKRLRDENLVLEYDPAIPPIPGVSLTGGWAYRRRVSGDGDLLIRVNEFTRLTEEGEDIWSFPAREP